MTDRTLATQLTIMMTYSVKPDILARNDKDYVVIPSEVEGSPVPLNRAFTKEST